MKTFYLFLAAAIAVGQASGARKKTVANLQKSLVALAEQVRMLQFYVEEQTRASGQSGVNVMRARGEGTRPYHGTHHNDDLTMAATHDHTDFFDTLGMGEIQACLNGVCFQTRHNDYRNVMKSQSSGIYGDTEPIEHPLIPPEVLQKETVEEQIDELREYFKAWRDQDEGHRPYKPYFKATLCYLEGAWTEYDPDTIQEPFPSDRHRLHAGSWRDLFQKTRFSSYSGTKHNLENFAFLPTTLWDVKDDGTLVVGQWNYNILCHPIFRDLPLNRLRGVDDLKTRMSTAMTFAEYLQTRNARFQVNPNDEKFWCDGPTKHGLLDELMEEIPGLNNYPGYLTDNVFDNTIKDFDEPLGSTTEKNTAYYHRWFQNEVSGANGVKIRRRGFNDAHLWAAMNTQDNILPITLKDCYEENGEEICESWDQKWSYAIPMEIIYRTPLDAWNPYNITYKGSDKVSPGTTVLEGPNGPRDGSNSLDKAFNGNSNSMFYRTPYEFFTGVEIGDDPADTPSEFVFVLDPDSNIRQVRGSGARTFFLNIPGVGIIRQRYPIHPVHSEGSPTWMESSAIADILMEPTKYAFM